MLVCILQLSSLFGSSFSYPNRFCPKTGLHFSLYKSIQRMQITGTMKNWTTWEVILTTTQTASGRRCFIAGG
nr:hypothetical protein CFP56_52597 [Quercus suber]